MNPVISTLLPAGLAFIMFALGLKLSVADFRRVLTYPVAVGLGLAAQTLLLPLTAFGIIAVFDLAPQAAVGLMILAACPGGVTAAMITELSRGDTCLSITLTACTSLLSFITVPIIVGFSLQHFLGQATTVDFPVGQAIGGLFLVTLVPVAAGLFFKEAGWLKPRVVKAIGRFATGVFLAIVFMTFFTEWPSITAHFWTIGPAILLLNVATMTTGALLGFAGANSEVIQGLSGLIHQQPYPRLGDLRFAQAQQVYALAEPGGSGVGARLAGDDIHHGCFTRTIWTQQGKNLTLTDIQVDVVECTKT